MANFEIVELRTPAAPDETNFSRYLATTPRSRKRSKPFGRRAELEQAATLAR